MICHRYKMYAKSQKLSCSKVLKRDENSMIPYILWIQEMWKKWAKFVSSNIPENTQTVKMYGYNVPVTINCHQHFDRWLPNNINQ